VTDAAPLPALLGTTAFRHPFRPYQLRALDAFERARAVGDTRIYLTMPPGSGKTVTGLEIVRRIGRPALVLGPTTAIVGQWLAEWAAFEPAVVAASASTDLPTPITVLTYQSIAVLDRGAGDDDADEPGNAAGPDDADEPGDAAGPDVATPSAQERRRRRVLVARGGDRDAVLGLLHPNGRAVVDRLAALGPVTLVLDECHHLLDLWGHVLEAVLDALPAGSTVVGLTATPPGDLGEREATLYRRLFGAGADFEIVTPAVVKDGHLAPYQELALVVRPTPAEEAWIGRQQERFDDLLRNLMDPAFATVPFGAWFATRILRRRSADGAPVGWATIERDDPDLARASLRRLWGLGEPVPAGAHLREEHRRPLEAADWIALLDAFVRDVLDPSQERVDAIARDQVRRALPAIGYVLTRRGIRASTSVVDRVLGVSAAKADAAARILGAEAAVLGPRLRAVVLCDFETAGWDARAATDGVLDPGAGSAAGALRTLLADPSTAMLRPVLVSGRSVACARSTAVDLVARARTDPELAAAFEGYAALDAAGAAPSVSGDPWDDIVTIDPGHPAWTSRRWVPLVTAFFEEGGTRCLVGTRAMLGEGWNAQRANVLVDLGAATTSVSVQQVRGRTLRLDPADPAKVADNWDVVCVAEGHVRGDADYRRFVRKHRAYFALGATGEIESGVSHSDPSLSPFGPPPAASFAALEAAMLARPALREGVRAAWRIGEPYRDVPVRTVRVHLGAGLGLPGRRLLRAEADAGAGGTGGAGPRGIAAGGAVVATGALAVAAVLGAPVAGLAAAGVLGGGAALASLRAAHVRLARLAPRDTLEDMGRAVADAMRSADMLAAGLGADAVRVVAQPDGYYRCLVAGASEEESGRFAEALEEVVSPLWDPRAIIPRRVEAPPDGLAATLGVVVRSSLARGRGAPQVWHAVPSALAGRKDRIAAFESAWSRWVSPGATALQSRDPRAQAVLALRTGDDPFRVETQLRTLWT
jgi:superfamily II DNA or RNA helicase